VPILADDVHWMDPSSQQALDRTALNDSGDLGEIIAAAELLAGTATPAVLDPAVAAGLVTIRENAVRFEHPLIRSSIYQQLSPAALRAGRSGRTATASSRSRASAHAGNWCGWPPTGPLAIH
jgi:hypothetical protein